MKFFKLPDLGEGLQEAEIVEWHVKEGQLVEKDALLVSVETAKAIVEIPSPQEGKISKLFGNPGDSITIGTALVEFDVADESVSIVSPIEKLEKVTILKEQPTLVLATPERKSILATPAVRSIAKMMGVDLSEINGTGKSGIITSSDLERAVASRKNKKIDLPLKGVRRSMAKAMILAHSEVVKVTICEDVNIHKWKPKTDITVRIIRAIIEACKVVPEMNAWFDSKELTLDVKSNIDIGIAVDTKDGLFVPVLRNAQESTPDQWRQSVDQLRKGSIERNLHPSSFIGATITLSNFGTLVGKYADPVIVPPSVCIIGSGRVRREAVAWGNEICAHPILPISLSFDHRALTGGDAARFLRALIDDLEKEE